MSQGPGGIRGPNVVVEGGVLIVEVASDAEEVEVSEAGVGVIKTYPVGPDKKARIPITWAAGAMLYVCVGRWPNRHVLDVEVIGALR
jgi:hypothetical protein